VTEQTDVLIIGSGFGGSVAAGRIAPHARVIVLERGKRWEPQEFQQTLDLKYWSQIYDFYPGKGIVAIQGKGVGGGSLVYSNVSLRSPSRIFDLVDETGRRLWPESYSRAELDPYYARVEEMLKVRQLAWDPPQRERWRAVPPGGRALAEGLGKLGRSCEPARIAIDMCRNCGWCNAGCKWGRKQNLTENYIPLAERHGADVRPLHEVTSIARARGGGYVVRYRRHDGSGAKGKIRARKVVLSCGTFRTPYLLQRSKLRLWRLSKHVGRHLSVNGDVVFSAILPGKTVERYKGKVIGTVSYAYLDQGFVFEGLYTPPLLSLITATDPESGDSVGPNMKDWTRQWGQSYQGFAAFGLDGMDGRVYPGPTGPLLSGAQTRDYYERVHAAAKEIIEEGMGGHMAPTIPDRFGMIETVHPVGACRMAAEDGEVWNYPGLHVLDGSVIPTPTMVNPSLTIAAVAERNAEKLLERL
jgi:choline dehydrogenase-like flavoprotein